MTYGQLAVWMTATRIDHGPRGAFCGSPLRRLEQLSRRLRRGGFPHSRPRGTRGRRRQPAPPARAVRLVREAPHRGRGGQRRQFDNPCRELHDVALGASTAQGRARSPQSRIAPAGPQSRHQRGRQRQLALACHQSGDAFIRTERRVAAVGRDRSALRRPWRPAWPLGAVPRTTLPR